MNLISIGMVLFIMMSIIALFVLYDRKRKQKAQLQSLDTGV